MFGKVAGRIEEWRCFLTELVVHLMKDRLVGSREPASSLVGVNMDRARRGCTAEMIWLMQQLDELRLEMTVVTLLPCTTTIHVGQDVTSTSVSERGVPPALRETPVGPHGGGHYIEIFLSVGHFVGVTGTT